MWIYGICWLPDNFIIQHNICDAQLEVLDGKEICKLRIPVNLTDNAESIKKAVDGIKNMGLELNEKEGKTYTEGNKGYISWEYYYENKKI
jgi:hypothetical protein